MTIAETTAPRTDRSESGAGPALPPEDRRLSPSTGFTRAHWEAVADRLVADAGRWASPHGARVDLPGRSSHSGPRSDGLEGYARTFLAAAFRVAGAEGEDPAGSLDRYAEGLVAGTAAPGRDDRESWPLIRDYHDGGQPMVEAASVALSLRMTRPWLWDRLDARQQDRAADWLHGALTSVPVANNWYLFPYAVAGFLEVAGRGDRRTAEVRERGLTLLDEWYLGEGWYTDGAAGSIDHYNGWALHLYPVLDQLLAARERGGAPDGAPAGLGGRHAERLTAHLEHFGRLFSADGAPVYWGRSMTYRFAAASSVGLGAAVGATPWSPGTSRTLISSCLRHFLDHDALDERGLLRLGWYGEHAASLQPYSGPASPYWASKAFACLLAPADHPLWTAPEEPAPATQTDALDAVSSAGILIQSTARDGIVRVHNHGFDRSAGAARRTGESDPLYSRAAYSTHTGPTAPRNPADNDLVVLRDGRRGVRAGVHPLGAGTEAGWGWAASWHQPAFEGGHPVLPGLRVLSVTLAHGHHEVRLHAVSGGFGTVRVEATGWATPVPRVAGDSDTGAPGAEATSTPTATLTPLLGWEHADQLLAPQGTAFAEVVEIPRLTADVDDGGVFVATASLTAAPGAAAGDRSPVEDIVLVDGALELTLGGDGTRLRIGTDVAAVAAGRTPVVRRAD